MAEGPFGILPRLTTLGPFVKADAEELAIDTTNGKDLAEADKTRYNNTPEILKDNTKFGKFVESNLQEDIRKIYRAGKENTTEASMVLCKHGKDKPDDVDDKPYTGDEINVGSTDFVEVPILSCNGGDPVGGIHNHLAYVHMEETPEPFDQVKTHHPSGGDLNNNFVEVEPTPGEILLASAVTITVAVNGKYDKHVSVLSSYDDRVRQLLFIYVHPKLKSEEQAKVYNQLIIDGIYEFKLDTNA